MSKYHVNVVRLLLQSLALPSISSVWYTGRRCRIRTFFITWSIQVPSYCMTLYWQCTILDIFNKAKRTHCLHAAMETSKLNIMLFRVIADVVTHLKATTSIDVTPACSFIVDRFPLALQAVFVNPDISKQVLNASYILMHYATSWTKVVICYINVTMPPVQWTLSQLLLHAQKRHGQVRDSIIACLAFATIVSKHRLAITHQCS